MNTRSARRLVAILAADIVGYSRLVSEDEDGTVQALQTVRADIFDPIIAAHGGRVANTAGDSLLLEFSSAVSAVDCALALQAGLAARTSEPALAMRIGLNVGDVISDGADILGGGVNVAARLEALAPPGGIFASRTIVDQAGSMGHVAFDPQGTKRVKNIPDPIAIYAVRHPSDGVLRGPLPRWLWPGLAGVLALAVVAGAAIYLWPHRPSFDPASEARMALPLPDKPSVAVLPFSDPLGSDGADLSAAGMADDLITDLSKVSELFVVASNAAFSAATTADTIAAFAETLGVRYVVTGRVRRTGNDVRLNLQLADATTGQVIWAQSYDGGMDGVFAAQDQFAVEIVSALGLALPNPERDEIERVETLQRDAKEAFQQGWLLYSRFNERDNTAAIPYFETAIARDPDYARAYGALALVHLRPHIFHHWNAFVDDGSQLHIGLFYDYLREATQRETSLIHVIRAMMYLTLQDAVAPDGRRGGTEDARIEAGRAIALRPNDPEAHITMAWAMIAGGEPAEGLRFVESAKRIDPAYPSHYVLFSAAAHFALGDLDAAITVLDAGLDRDPAAVELLPIKASLLALSGDQRAARGAVDRWQTGQNPAALDAAVDEYLFIVRWVEPNAHLNETLKNGLRLAALPEATSVAQLQDALRTGDSARQRQAAEWLGLFGSAAAAAVPDLVDLLDSPSVFVRREALTALGRIGPDAAGAVPALLALENETLIGRLAAGALDRIGRPDD